ncbi:Golgi phospho protein 3-domain-containing protein [Catenaria anguillulae PL171]|uniref:Golgi phospho protein 3-domain-containing protein n=1 Tax=Catenaria anguillulae PL171 TaxID=765915 RepID=A0A1Y2HFN0_9FUNG|nr:Golgi phospho protein 3-domain-containing protein [Catenaria anguillulae PL171]
MSSPSPLSDPSSSSTVVRRRAAAAAPLAPGSSFSTSDADLAAAVSSSSPSSSPTPDDTPKNRSHSPPRRTPSTISASAGSPRAVFSATTTLPDGTKLAWDPTEHLSTDDHDLVPLADPLPVPQLTLMEQILLLGLKDRAGYLSFWNDSLSYVLRGCILIELALRGRIAMVARPERRRIPLADRPIRVVDATPTGETLLDETLKCMRLTQEGAFVGTSSGSAPVTGVDYTTGGAVKRANSGDNGGGGGWGALFGIRSSTSTDVAANGGSGSPTSPTSGSSPSGTGAGEHWGVGSWMDLLSGETWNLLRVNYQLRQVRERLAKGLVDKGILRTERRSFVLFDMATHPVADQAAKDKVTNLVLSLVRTAPKSSGWPPNTSIRHIALVAAAQAGNVLENVLVRLPTLGDREAAWQRADEMLAGFAKWPADAQLSEGSSSGGPVLERRASSASGSGASALQTCKVMGLDHLEVVAAVLSVFARMDSLL